MQKITRKSKSAAYFPISTGKIKQRSIRANIDRADKQERAEKTYTDAADKKNKEKTRNLSSICNAKKLQKNMWRNLWSYF